MNPGRLPFTATLFILGIAIPARAQTEWLGPGIERAAWVRVLRPDVDDATLPSTSWALGIRYPFEAVTLVAELPFAHGGLDRDRPGDRSQTALGNPYVGVVWVGESAEGSLGVRLPLASNDEGLALRTGFASDPVDRQEAFVDGVLPIEGGIRATTPFGRAEAWTFVVRADLAAWISTSGGGGQTIFRLGGEVWREGRRLSGGAGVVTRAIVSSGNLTSIEQLGGAIDVRLPGGWRPGVEFRVPLDGDFREEVSGYTVGVRVVLER